MSRSGPVGDRRAVAGVPVAALLLLVIGIGVFTFGYGQYQSAQATLDEAVEVEATIVSSELETVRDTGGVDDDDDSDDVEYRVSVTFEYQFEGERYESSYFDAAGATWRTYDRRAAAEDQLQRFSEGTTVTAYVPPDEPEAAFLVDRVPLSVFMIMAFGVLLSLLGVGLAGRAYLRP